MCPPRKPHAVMRFDRQNTVWWRISPEAVALKAARPGAENPRWRPGLGPAPRRKARVNCQVVSATVLSELGPVVSAAL